MLRELNDLERSLVAGGTDTVTFRDNDRNGQLSQGDDVLYYTHDGVNYTPDAYASMSSESYWCQTADAMQIAGAAGAVYGGVVAGAGLLTGPGEAALGPIGGAIATAGGATGGAGYLIGKAAGCD